MKVKKISFIAVTCALLCILSPITIPLGSVSLSLSTLVLGTAALVIGFRTSAVVLLLYVLLGCIGLPVFSGFSSGFVHLLGPTGGFIIGYFPFISVICGLKKSVGTNTICDTISLICGTLVLYLFGCIWFMFNTNCDLPTALYTVVLPYIPVDTVKIIISILSVDRIRCIIRKY